MNCSIALPLSQPAGLSSTTILPPCTSTAAPSGSRGFAHRALRGVRRAAAPGGSAARRSRPCPRRPGPRAARRSCGCRRPRAAARSPESGGGGACRARRAARRRAGRRPAALSGANILSMRGERAAADQRDRAAASPPYSALQQLNSAAPASHRLGRLRDIEQRAVEVEEEGPVADENGGILPASARPAGGARRARAPCTRPRWRMRAASSSMRPAQR